MQHQPDGHEVGAFGFLTVVESPAHGLFGGYLLVDALGRPLEFHCTTPVKISRAQQILYGPTLHGHVHGRQIGGVLLAEGAVAPLVVLTDVEAMLQVRPHTKLPMAFVRRGDPETTTGFVVGGSHVHAHAEDSAQEPVIRERLADLAAAVDLWEPFERIRLAIDEAQRH